MLRRFGLLMLLALALGPPAHAAVDLPGRPMGGPILLDDGTIVFGVARTPQSTDILRLAPGESTPRRITRIAVPKPDPRLPHGVGVSLSASGNGFFVFVAKSTMAPNSIHTGSVRLTWFPDVESPGVEISSCAADCGPYDGGSVDWLHLYAADGGHAVLGGRTFPCPCQSAVVRDMATGADTPVPASIAFVNTMAGHYLAGRTPANDGAVVDWTTGKTVSTYPGAWFEVLRPDGTLFYDGGPPGSVVRLRPGDSEPTRLAVEGDLRAATDDRLLTVTYDGTQVARLRAGSVDGTLLDELAWAPGTVAFDGRRAVYMDSPCATTRLQQWVIGSDSDPPLLTPICGPARVVGKVALGPHTAKVAIRCPADLAQGCAGAVSLAAPRIRTARRVRVVLAPGEQRTYTLLAGLKRATCRKLARTRAWSLRLETDTFSGRDTALLPVARRNTCIR